MNQNENDYVSLVRIPRKWFNVFVWTFSSLVVANVLIELCTHWAWEALGETILTRTAVLMTLIVGWFFILAHTVEVIMLGYAKLYRDRILAQGREEGRTEGRTEGRAEGRTEGKAEGRTEVYRELQRAQREGITLEELLKTHDLENDDDENDQSSSSENS